MADLMEENIQDNSYKALEKYHGIQPISRHVDMTKMVQIVKFPAQSRQYVKDGTDCDSFLQKNSLIKMYLDTHYLCRDKIQNE